MADLLRDNDCAFDCEFYDSEANDHYFQWCSHPDSEEHTEPNNNPFADITDYVVSCPLGKWLPQTSE